MPHIEKRVTKMQNQCPFKSFNRMLRSNDTLAVRTFVRGNSTRGGRANVIANYDRMPCAMQLDSFCSLAPCPCGCVCALHLNDIECEEINNNKIYIRQLFRLTYRA